MSNEFLNGLQAASNAVAGNVAGPVDILALLLRKAGMPVPENAIGGSNWMTQKGLMAPVRQGASQVIGETAGLLGPAMVSQFGPQIARGLLKGGENLAAPRTLNQQRGVVAMPDGARRMEIAQRNAAKPVSEGGLGLGPKNTAQERAEAMGFTTDAYHGTPDDAISRTRQFKNEKLGKSTRVSDAAKGHFTSDRGEVASEFIWRDGSTDGGNVLPLLLRGDRDTVRLPGEWMPGKYDAALDAAKAAGKDGLNIQGVTTLGRPGDYQVTFDPRNIRSRFAAFDPARRDTADILGGADPYLLALLGLGAGGAAYYGGDR